MSKHNFELDSPNNFFLSDLFFADNYAFDDRIESYIVTELNSQMLGETLNGNEEKKSNFFSTIDDNKCACIDKPASKKKKKKQVKVPIQLDNIISSK